MDEVPHRILVVDDDPTICVVTRLVLQDHGYAVDCASDGDVALSMIRRDPPDLVILDIYMPRMKGTEVLFRLREEGIRLPVIAVSGECNETEGKETVALGAEEFIAKPLDFDHLVTRVRDLLRAHDAVTHRHGGGR